MYRASSGFRKGTSCGVAALTVMAGCAVLYPELRTSLRDADEGEDVEGRAPRQMAYIEFRKARIPPKAPDGRPWDDAEDDPPDPVARLIVDQKTLIETPVEEDTYTPTWPNQRRANYVVRRGSAATVELIDRDSVTDRPICTKTIGDIRSDGDFGSVEVMCDNGARIWLTVRRPRPKVGLGLFYEVRNGQAFVSRTAVNSPAGRAGLLAGDELLELDGQPVSNMDKAQVRSAFNAGSRNGLRVKARRPGGAAKEVVIKEGAVYVTEEDSEDWGSAVFFEE